MKLLNFDKYKSMNTGYDENNKNVDVSSPPKESYVEYETDSPQDLVTGEGDPNDHSPEKLPPIDLTYAPTTYQVEPGHGMALVDVLRRVAKSLVHIAKKDEGPANASKEVNWKKAFVIIKRAFRSYGMKLVEFKHRHKNDAIPYYVKNTPEGLYFWVTPKGKTEAAIAEAHKQLKTIGFSAVVKECGILLTENPVSTNICNLEEIASYAKGIHVSSKNGWAVVEIGDYHFHYKYVKNDNILHIHSLQGPIETATTYNVHDGNEQKIAKVLRYQAVKYQKMFEPETFGLKAEGKPFKLKKHSITYCGDGKSLIVTPNDEVYAVTDKGESLLCRPEGKIGLKIELTFKPVTNNTKYVCGDIWSKFGHLLAKRGLLV
jgi:hypothetical protein